MSAEMRITDDYTGAVIDDGVYYEVMLEAPPTPTGNQRVANLHFRYMTEVIRLLLSNEIGVVSIRKRTIFNIAKHNSEYGKTMDAVSAYPPGMESGYPSATNSADTDHECYMACPCKDRKE